MTQRHNNHGGKGYWKCFGCQYMVPKGEFYCNGCGHQPPAKVSMLEEAKAKGNGKGKGSAQAKAQANGRGEPASGCKCTQ